MGECTKCAGVFVLDKGTCNDSKLLKMYIAILLYILLYMLTDCGIANCVLCDKVDMKCIQCQEGYREINGDCSGRLQYSIAISLI